MMKVTHQSKQSRSGHNNRHRKSNRAKRRTKQRKGMLPGNATVFQRTITENKTSHALKERSYRELGADELLIYPDPATPFLTIEDYIKFRKEGPEYLRQRFRESGVKLPEELWWLLQNCDMLLTFHRDDSELPVLQYAFAITIWIYLYAAGCVNFTGRIFTGPNTWTYGRIEDVSVKRADKNDLTKKQL